MMDCIKKTLAKEGPAGLYAGATSPLAGAMAHNAGVFFSYGAAKVSRRPTRVRVIQHEPRSLTVL